MVDVWEKLMPKFGTAVDEMIIEEVLRAEQGRTSIQVILRYFRALYEAACQTVSECARRAGG